MKLFKFSPPKPTYQKRDIISHKEGKLPVIRFIGFCTMMLGLPGLFFAVFYESGSGVAVTFFIIMLGYSFSFPELLEGNEGLSTMRIIVFMVTNVICMLLLKIGWSAQSLEAIKLDEWWVGIIAFVFGAKAVQSYFEHRAAPASSVQPAGPSISMTDADYVNLAIGQNQSMLYAKGNIRLLVSGKKVVNNRLIDCVTIHLKDDHFQDIPRQLVAILPSGTQRLVETEIIESVDKPRVSLDAGDSIAAAAPPDFRGSIGALVKLRDGTPCLLTCSHVMTKGSGFNHNGLLPAGLPAKLHDVNQGAWFYALRDIEFDIALIREFTANSLGLPNNLVIQGFRAMVPEDTKQTKVTMIGRTDHYGSLPSKNAVSGYVVNYQAINSITLGYADGDFALVNLMLLSRSAEPPYTTISRPGDSGSLVLDESNRAIGIVVAQNSKFTYAISFDRILKKLTATL